MFLFPCLTIKTETSKENKFVVQASFNLNCTVKHQDSCSKTSYFHRNILTALVYQHSMPGTKSNKKHLSFLLITKNQKSCTMKEEI